MTEFHLHIFISLSVVYTLFPMYYVWKITTLLKLLLLIQCHKICVADVLTCSINALNHLYCQLQYCRISAEQHTYFSNVTYRSFEIE